MIDQNTNNLLELLYSKWDSIATKILWMVIMIYKQVPIQLKAFIFNSAWLLGTRELYTPVRGFQETRFWNTHWNRSFWGRSLFNGGPSLIPCANAVWNQALLLAPRVHSFIADFIFSQLVNQSTALLIYWFPIPPWEHTKDANSYLLDTLFCFIEVNCLVTTYYSV